jgi:hypothetical protein
MAANEAVQSCPRHVTIRMPARTTVTLFSFRMLTISSMLFCVTFGSIPRSPSSAPVSRMTMSNFRFRSQVISEPVPCLSHR